ncbi:MAG: MBL fold metallo-hydrolase [Candidatus Lokiarchaeota archaeon]|nr:MBL fold metallo-hydrolase [Candidatus Lokiarchaeota archaeon]
MKIKWISHSCFQIIKEGKTVIYTDPYKIDSNEEKADIILISHEHYDHADKKSINKVIKDTTELICPVSSQKKLKKFNPKGLKPGELVKIDEIQIEAVRAYNIGKQFYPKNNDWLGYIIEIEGKRLYHAGDTDYIDEMKSLGKIDVAMLPVGDTYTMDFEQAVKACDTIKPKICLPMHQWDHDLQDFKSMAQDKVPEVEIKLIEGEIFQI